MEGQQNIKTNSNIYVTLQFVFDCYFIYICDPIQHNGDGSPEKSLNVPLPVLSPSSILPPASSHCTFNSARKNLVHF